MTKTLAVAVPGPFLAPLDYLPPSDSPQPPIGSRVRVPLGRREVIGIVTAEQDQSTINESRLRAVTRVVDEAPLLPTSLISLIAWAARYYHHPIGEAYATALPARLRQGQPAVPGEQTYWRITTTGREQSADAWQKRAPRQAMLLQALKDNDALAAGDLAGLGGDARGALQRLVERGFAEAIKRSDYGTIQAETTAPAPVLNDAQAATAARIMPGEGHQAILLEGVTGSGKTEVYLDAIARATEMGLQSLVIVPEIGLTPQLLSRFRRRLNARIAVLHSGLADGERLNAWLAAAHGRADVIIGTRSAVFVPLARPGLMIVDEEHDASLKQQEGFRYSARDLAVLRAHRAEVPVVLGSATPALETLANAAQKRYLHCQLNERAGNARPPSMQLLDMRGQPTQEGLSQPLITRVGEHLEADGQVLLFLNRRGFAPVIICHECGWLAECERCDARYTYHRGRRRLHCHHCDSERRIPDACPQCGSVDLRPLGLGTERIEAALEAAFPETPLVRIDRDTTRRRGGFEQQMAAAVRGDARLLLGTQMLAKGHHLPAVTLVAIIDADQGLFGADFRAAERLAQLVVQVAGRAGRAERPGEVVIQTHHPEHPLLQTLIHGGYPAFARTALLEREAAGLPPSRAMALLRAEAVQREAPMRFLRAASQIAPQYRGLECLGPYPAPMEKRAGRFRAQLMLQADERAVLQTMLEAWVPQLQPLREARAVRWSIDVDPTETL